jgi:hypothetical protein
MQNNINSLKSLNKEISSLYNRKNELEKQLSNNWEHLQQNFPVMLRNSIFKRAEEKAKNTWAYTFFSIPKVQEAIGNATEKLAGKAEEILLHWFDKFFPNKKETPV